MTKEELETIKNSTDAAKDETDISIMDYELLDCFATQADIAYQLTRIADALEKKRNPITGEIK